MNKMPAFIIRRKTNYVHTTHIWNIKWQKYAGMGLNGFIFKKINKNWNIKTNKKSWEPFRSCLLKSTANPAQFWWKWAGQATYKRLPGFFFSLIFNFHSFFFNVKPLRPIFDTYYFIYRHCEETQMTEIRIFSNTWFSFFRIVNAHLRVKSLFMPLITYQFAGIVLELERSHKNNKMKVKKGISYLC